MFEYIFMTEILSLVVALLFGKYTLYFIPIPIIGGLIFFIFTLIEYRCYIPFQINSYRYSSSMYKTFMSTFFLILFPSIKIFLIHLLKSTYLVVSSIVFSTSTTFVAFYISFIMGHNNDPSLTSNQSAA
ncbi:MAG: hypothetical protein ACRC9L_01515 [Brevinema sp.]